MKVAPKLPFLFRLAEKMKKGEEIPGFDEIVFENRNKDYGAYFLRRKYNNVVLGGIIFSVLAGSLAVLLPFLIKPPEGTLVGGGGRFISMQMETLEVPVEQIIIPPAPPPKEITKQQEIIKYVPPVVVDTVLNMADTPPTNDEVLAFSDEEADELTESGLGDMFDGEGGFGDDEPFLLVEVMPSFRGGGLDEFRRWVTQRTNYPPEALEKKIQGRVFLTFVVETDGSVTNVTVQKGIDPLVDAAAVKTIESSPKWSPGLQRGKAVRVRYSLALLFLI